MRKPVLVLAAALAVAFPGMSAADDASAQLDAANKAIQDLEGRVKSLEAEKANAAGAGAPVVAPSAKPQEGAANADKARVEIYGFTQMDAIQDFKRVDPDWNATLRPSKIPVNCGGANPDPGCGKNGETVFSVRQTRLGANGFVPTSEGELRTQFEFDLFGVGADAGQTTFRLRQAWGEIGPFLVGQTNSLFMDGDVYPNTIDYWGPSGMIFFRNVQARWTPYRQDGMKFAVALEGPGNGVDNSSAGFGNVTAHNSLPDLTAQLRMDRDWGHAQVAGILRKVGYETTGTANGDPSGSKTGYGLNLTSSYKTFGNDKINAQLAYGKGIAAYSNDCCVDLATDAAGNAELVPLLDWMLYYDHWWNAKLSSSIGYSENFQNNTSGQAGSAQRIGQYSSVNLLYYPVKNVMTGVELLYGRRENKDGAAGDDTRIQFSAKFNF